MNFIHSFIKPRWAVIELMLFWQALTELQKLFSDFTVWGLVYFAASLFGAWLAHVITTDRYVVVKRGEHDCHDSSLNMTEFGMAVFFAHFAGWHLLLATIIMAQLQDNTAVTTLTLVVINIVTSRYGPWDVVKKTTN